MIWLRLASFLIFTIYNIYAMDAWQKPGCHKVGNTRKINIPDCVEFFITTNACRGFCESYAVPSVPWGWGINSNAVISTMKGKTSSKPLVSIGQCCNMMKAEQIEKRVLCLDGMRTYTFKSAVSCSCYHCKKE